MAATMMRSAARPMFQTSTLSGRRKALGRPVQRRIPGTVASLNLERQAPATHATAPSTALQRLVTPQKATLVASSVALATMLLAAPAFADQIHGITELQDLAEAYIPGVVGDSPFREGVVSGFLLILFSEIGDKTFFIALLLALKQSKTSVFAGTFGALAVMTVISVALGQVFHQLDQLLPQTGLPLDDILAAALLIFFGVKTLQDAANEEEDKTAGEKEEAEEAVAGFNSSAAGLILSTFTLVFAAEWGDKSFLATIALAAASSPAGVTLGAIGGHGVATGMAVAGGSVLAKYIDEKVLQYVGGGLFLVFAASTIVDLIAETSM